MIYHQDVLAQLRNVSLEVDVYSLNCYWMISCCCLVKVIKWKLCPLLSYLICSLLYYSSFRLVSFCPSVLTFFSSCLLSLSTFLSSTAPALSLCVLCLISCLLVSPCHVWCLLVSSRVFLSFISFLISLSPVSPPSSPRSHEVMSNWVSSLLLWWFSRNILNCFGQILDQRQRAGRVDRKWLCVNLIVCSLSVLPFSRLLLLQQHNSLFLCVCVFLEPAEVSRMSLKKFVILC